MNKPQATETRSRRAVASTVLALTFLASCVIAWTDRRFYINAGYATDIRPSYWPHGLLFAFYAGDAFALARAAIWKTAIVVLAGLSFGIWSMFVVDAALDPSTLPPPFPSIASGVDAFAGRAGAGPLSLGILVSGIAASIALTVLTMRPRVGAIIAGATIFAGLLAILGWGDSLGPASHAALMASSALWHTAAASALLLGWKPPAA